MEEPSAKGSRGLSVIGALALVGAIALGGMTFVGNVTFFTTSPSLVFAADAPKSAPATSKDCGKTQYLERKANSTPNPKKSVSNIQQECIAGCVYVVSPHIGTTPSSGGKKIIGSKVSPVNAKPASSSGSCVVYRCGMHIPDNKEPSRSRSVPITTPNAPPLTGICDRFEIATESTGWSWFGAWKKNPNADAKLDEITNSALEYAAEKQTKKVVDEISSRGESAVPTNLNENGLKTLRDALTAEGKSAWLSSTRTNTNAGIAEVKKQLNAIADGVKDSASPPTNIKKYGDDPTTGILFVSEELANRLKNNEGYRCNDAGDGTWTCIPPAQNARTLTPPPDPRKAEQERIRQLEEQLRAANARQQQQQTFGNPSGAGSGSGGLGSLGQMLKGITGGGQPAAGNGVPQPAGTCSPSFICGGNTLYSRNNQCVDQAVQQCPYGCSGNQCAQTPSQCQPAPTQPNPANCQNGTWKPTYGGQNNACVVGWQCVRRRRRTGVRSGEGL